MKKRFLIGVVVLLLLCPLLVFALVDEEAPTLDLITLSTYELEGGKNVTINVQGNDDYTGIGTVDVELRLKNDHSVYFTLASDVTPGNNVTYTKKVPDNVVPGEYEIFAVQVWDAASNLRTYYIGSDDFPFNRTDVTVKDNGKDFGNPTLSNIRVSPQTTTYPKNFTITAEAHDDKSKVTQVTFVYEINGKMYTYQLNRTSGNTFSAKAYLDENFAYSDAKFIAAWVYDEHSNSTKYMTDESRDIYGGKNVILSQNLDVVFSNKLIDREKPVLKECNYSSTKVAAPGTLTISCNITDDTGIGDVKIYFQGYTKDGKLIDSLIFYSSYYKDKKQAVSKHVFDQYTAESTFYIDKVEITDLSGKKSIYSIYDDGNLDMEKKTLTLVQAVISDDTTSTVDNKYLDKIEKLEEGKSISVDTTSGDKLKAEAFDAIKGRDIDMVVVNDGIQWVFNGKDIINETKDINTEVKVSKIDLFGHEIFAEMFDTDNYAIVIEFANNGLLPGRALVKIKADYALRNYVGDTDLFVYYFDKQEEGLETIAKKISLSDEGYYEFYITHNSKYIISKKPVSSKNIVKDSTEDLGNVVLEDGTLVGEVEDIVDNTNPSEEDKRVEYGREFAGWLAISVGAGVVLGLIVGIAVLKFRKKR